MDNSPRKQRGKEKDEVTFPQAEALLNLPEEYLSFMVGIKQQIAE